MVSEYDFHREDWSMGSNVEGIKEAEPAPAKAGLWEDFVDIFYAPSSVFARRADGKFGMALLFLVIVGTILYFLTRNAIQPMMDAEFARRSADMLRKNPNLTQEQLSSGRNFFPCQTTRANSQPGARAWPPGAPTPACTCGELPR